MAQRDLRYIGDQSLTMTCAPVADHDDALRSLISDMFETMYAAQGRGLAAPQVGVTQRIFVTDTTWKEGDKHPMAFVNPEITATASTSKTGPEACLSIPDRSFDVSRPTWVDLAWTDPHGHRQTARFDGIDAICVCHELDHLDGLLITQTGVEI